jgi:large subunit ribosomal protein L30e
MANESLDNVYQEIKIKIKDNKVIFGADRTLKLLKNGEIEKIVLASNCPNEFKERINYYKKINGNLQVFESDLDREELGKVLGVPFLVAVVGVKK